MTQLFIAPPSASMRDVQALYASWMYEACGRRKGTTAKVLGIAYNTLTVYLERASALQAQMRQAS